MFLLYPKNLDGDCPYDSGGRTLGRFAAVFALSEKAVRSLCIYWNRRPSAKLCVVLVVIGVWGAGAEERGPGASGGRVVFHIPAQPLATALQAYSEITGVQVLYES